MFKERHCEGPGSYSFRHVKSVEMNLKGKVFERTFSIWNLQGSCLLALFTKKEASVHFVDVNCVGEI